MKNMKKISVKTVVICVVILICAYFYAYIDKMHPLFDPDVPTSEYISTGVLYDGTIEQTFTMKENMLDGMYVKCQIADQSDDVEIMYELVDMKSDQVVAKGSMPGSKLKNNQFTKLRFDKTIENCKGKTYRFVLQEKGASEFKGVGFCYETKQEEGTEMSLRGEKKEGTMIAKTMSHRFDVETFIVLMGFIMFIAIFFRVLYNLFK